MSDNINNGKYKIRKRTLVIILLMMGLAAVIVLLLSGKNPAAPTSIGESNRDNSNQNVISYERKDISPEQRQAIIDYYYSAHWIIDDAFNKFYDIAEEFRKDNSDTYNIELQKKYSEEIDKQFNYLRSLLVPTDVYDYHWKTLTYITDIMNFMYELERNRNFHDDNSDDYENRFKALQKQRKEISELYNKNLVEYGIGFKYDTDGKITYFPVEN